MFGWLKKRKPANEDHAILPHPLAEAFPMIEGDAFDALVDSIRHDGQLEPILIYEGRVLDGRNRLKACGIAGIAPQLAMFDGTHEEAVRIVFARNIARRHLTPSQLAMAAAQLSLTAKLEIDEAARQLNASRASVVRARQVLASGDAEIVERVTRGQMSVHDAQQRVAGKTPANVDQKAQRLIRDLRKLLATSHEFSNDTREAMAALTGELAAVAAPKPRLRAVK